MGRLSTSEDKATINQFMKLYVSVFSHVRIFKKQWDFRTTKYPVVPELQLIEYEK